MTNAAAPPSAIAMAIATGIIAALGGYFIGQARSLGLGGTGGRSNDNSAFRGKRSLQRPDYNTSEDDDSSDDDDDDSSALEEEEKEDENLDGQAQGDLQGFAGSREECKLVLVVRTDLGMGKGKIAAQCGHATLACYKTLLRAGSPVLGQWERYGQAKVAVQVRTEEELETLQAQAMSLGVCAQIIHDAGRTQIASGSATVLGVGPAPKSVVDRITGGLKLL